MTNLLCIDWDAFFPTVQIPDPDWQLFDWGHRETVFFIDGPLWLTRANLFAEHGRDLPSVTGHETFWDSIQIRDDAPPFIAESNSQAADGAVITPDVVLSVNLDAHHDAGYTEFEDGAAHDEMLNEMLQQGVWQCDNWMVLHDRVADRVAGRYPAWALGAAMKYEPTPWFDLDRGVWDPSEWADVVWDRVFLCRSGAWVPPWCDHDLLAFIDAFPGGDRIDLDEGDPSGLSALRPRWPAQAANEVSVSRP